VDDFGEFSCPIAASGANAIAEITTIRKRRILLSCEM
jgi:hypothetical protein